MTRLRSRVAAGQHSTGTRSVFSASDSQPTQLCFQNKAQCSIDISWVNYEGGLQKYSTVQPGGIYTLSSFSTHPWRMHYANGRCFTYMGASALLVLLPDQLDIQAYVSDPDADDTSWQDPAWGSYEQRGSVLGMAVMAYACVCQEAVWQACRVVQHMLADCQGAVLQRMVAAGCSIAIIGRNQVTTDIPPHHFMKARSSLQGARDIDGTTRGVGATAAVPTASCGEENITMLDDRRYPKESILVHELAHAVMNLGLDKQQRRRVEGCYEHAKAQQLYDPGCYMMADADEYWAEACQSFFDATVRSDVNCGINTRDKLQQYDPQLAQLLAEVFGCSSWRYPHIAPAPFQQQQHTASSKAQQRQQQHQKQRQRKRRQQQHGPMQHQPLRRQQQRKEKQHKRGGRCRASTATTRSTATAGVSRRQTRSMAAAAAAGGTPAAGATVVRQTH